MSYRVYDVKHLANLSNHRPSALYLMFTGVRGGFEVYECDLEGWTKQPTSQAVGGFHSEEAEKWYALFVCVCVLHNVKVHTPGDLALHEYQ